MDRQRNKAQIALMAAMVLWSTSFVALKMSFETYDPFFIIFGRLVVASLFLLIFIKKILRGNSFERRDLFLLPLLSLFEPCLYFVFESLSLQQTSSSQAAIITAILPLIVAVSAAIILKEGLPLRTVIGFLLATAGAVMLGIFSDSNAQAPDPIKGNLLEFIAVLCATGYTLTLRILSPRYNPFMITLVQSVIGSLFFLPIVLFRDNGIPKKFLWEPMAAIVYMGILVSVLAYSLYNFGMGRVKAARGAAYINLIPVFSLYWGWLVLNETLNREQVLSCLLIAFGVIMSQFRIRNKSKKNSCISQS